MDPALTLALTIVFCVTALGLVAMIFKRWMVVELVVKGLLGQFDSSAASGDADEGKQS